VAGPGHSAAALLLSLSCRLALCVQVYLKTEHSRVMLLLML
jgi:hypothetical protein